MTGATLADCHAGGSEKACSDDASKGDAHVCFDMNLIPTLKRMPASDLRDWTAIRAWAHGLTVQLQTDH